MNSRVVLIGLIVFLLVAAFAVPGYCDDPIKKLGRGLSNLCTFPLEILLQISKVNNSDGPMAAGTWGVLNGLGMSGLRLLAGVYEVVTFPVPVPKDYLPLMRDPEFIFEDSNW